jgi:RNA polymerase sigma factor (sigma-70 family)
MSRDRSDPDVMSADEEYTARGHVGPLIEHLTETLALGLVVPADKEEYAELERSLSAHFARVGRSNFDDLGSWVLLECLEKYRGGTKVDWAEVLRAADRIRRRITRQHARERALPDADVAVDAAASSPSSAIDLKSLLKNLPQTDLVIFHSFYLEGKKPADIGERLGMSQAQVYRRLGTVRNMLMHHLR